MPAVAKSLGPCREPKSTTCGLTLIRFELIEAGLIASDLAAGMQNGYQFATSVEGETFTVHADPILPGETGTRHFFADKSGVIRWSIEGPATIFSPGFGESEPGPE